MLDDIRTRSQQILPLVALIGVLLFVVYLFSPLFALY